MRDNGVTDKGAEAVARCLRVNSTLTAISYVFHFGYIYMNYVYVF